MPQKYTPNPCLANHSIDIFKLSRVARRSVADLFATTFRGPSCRRLSVNSQPASWTVRQPSTASSTWSPRRPVSDLFPMQIRCPSSRLSLGHGFLVVLDGAAAAASTSCSTLLAGRPVRLENGKRPTY